MLICWPCLVVRPAFMMKRRGSIGRNDSTRARAISGAELSINARRALLQRGVARGRIASGCEDRTDLASGGDPRPRMRNVAKRCVLIVRTREPGACVTDSHSVPREKHRLA